jgi:hypothetical protein
LRIKGGDVPTTETEQSSSGNEDSLENARVRYQAAVDLWTHQDGISWGIFNAMLVAHSTILAVIGVILTTKPQVWGFAAGLAVVGLVLGIAWLTMIIRGFAYQTFWTLAATEFERD